MKTIRGLMGWVVFSGCVTALVLVCNQKESPDPELPLDMWIAKVCPKGASQKEVNETYDRLKKEAVKSGLIKPQILPASWGH